MDKNTRMDSALLLLRGAVGFIFILHGLMKVFGVFGGPGIEGFSAMLQSLGFGFAPLWAWVAALAELIGGACLILGLFVRISAALIGIVMIVAIAAVHWPHGFFLANNGFEYPFLILCVCISLILAGGGRLSLNNGV